MSPPLMQMLSLGTSFVVKYQSIVIVISEESRWLCLINSRTIFIDVPSLNSLHAQRSLGQYVYLPQENKNR